LPSPISDPAVHWRVACQTITTAYFLSDALPEGYLLFDKENVLLAPHVAFATEEAFVRRAEMAFKNIACWLEGKLQNKIL
jgi:phosphoglycerate dehydrogenase-like enzyme